MNLKKTFITAVSTLAIVLSMASPAGVAAPVDTATGVVQVADAGVFSVSICEVTGDRNFGTVGVSTIGGGTGTAKLTICYVDNMMDRPGFITYLIATKWTNIGRTGNIPGTTIPLPQTDIPAQNLTPVRVYGPVATQLQDGRLGGTIYGADGASGYASPVLVGTTPGSLAWNSGPLDTAQKVGYGDRGRGTTFTTAQVDLRLTVPANTYLGTYQTTITLDLGPR